MSELDTTGLRALANELSATRMAQNDEGHRLGRVHDGVRWCTDRGCNWGWSATYEEQDQERQRLTRTYTDRTVGT